MEPAHQLIGHSHSTLMKRLPKMPFVLLLLAPAACLLSWAWHPPAEAAEIEKGYSTNTADEVKCKLQLNMIYGAIQQYREQHGALPDKLADLTPELIHDPNVLVCPYVRERGGLRTWRSRFRDVALDPYTSYSYEFVPKTIDQYNWRGAPKKTWREFKERQQKELGPVVPIARCLLHRPRLNLAIGGTIYESGEYWEKKFSEDERLVSVAGMFQIPAPDGPLPRTEFAPRDPKAGSRMLDLTANYNATLTNGWQGFPGNHLATLPTGIQNFAGVEFDVRGVIQLRGTELAADFPATVTGISVEQKCQRIHFLHAVSFTYLTNTVQASYVAHYANGEARTFPVVYGQHIADWWHEPGSTNALKKAIVAWTGQNEASKAYDMAISLYRTVWENPLKDTVITTITFDAGAKKYLAGPFVVAITLE
jgi:hypothetical protein